MEIILSCDLIKMAECMAAKPVVDEGIDGGKIEADSRTDSRRIIGKTSRIISCVKTRVN